MSRRMLVLMLCARHFPTGSCKAMGRSTEGWFGLLFGLGSSFNQLSVHLQGKCKYSRLQACTEKRANGG